MTYSHFLLTFLIVPIVLLALGLRRRLCRRYVCATVLMAVVAFVYTTPWDNLIVALGVWTYDPARIWGILLGVVPLEEYLFYLLQSVLTALVLLALAPLVEHSTPRPSPAGRGAAAWTAGLLVVVLPLLLAATPLDGGRWTYFLLEVGWALPVIVGQWLLGREVLRARWRTLLAAVLVPTVYLSLADSLAIHEGIWTLSPNLTLGLALAGIPLEEALFFLLTNTMLVQGLLLAMDSAVPLARLRRLWRRALPASGS